MKNEERNSQRLHAPPPAMSASVVFVREPGFRPSISLYHDNRPPAAIINPTPTTLTVTCMATPPEISLMAKWAAKARNTPKQKISNECWPHQIAGWKTGQRKAGQVWGTYQTTTAPSARKCAKRKTSRLVLSIG